MTSAIAQPSLGRDLSSGNVTVNLVEPGTLYGARQNNIDVRIAKILRFGRTRAQFGVDVYNLLNTDVVTGYNNGYSPDRRVADARPRSSPRATRGSTWSWTSKEGRLKAGLKVPLRTWGPASPALRRHTSSRPMLTMK